MKKGSILLVTSILITGFLGGVLAWSWNNLPPQIPWYYSLPFGEQQLVDKRILIGTLVGAVVALVLTKLVARWAGKKDETVELTIMFGSLIAVILLAATFLRIIGIFGLT